MQGPKSLRNVTPIVLALGKLVIFLPEVCEWDRPEGSLYISAYDQLVLEQSTSEMKIYILF